MTQASSDGWTENIAAPGQALLDAYPNDQRAAMLWYHDHVMGVTRFNVYAGLAGLWIVRDDRERELELPEGPPYEVPLVLSDRNFDLDDGGRLTGDLLHKTDPEVMECFSPFTTVNGTVWPHLDVEPTTYRFRLLNGSNARTYRLVLTRDDEPDHERITRSAARADYSKRPSRLLARDSCWRLRSEQTCWSTSRISRLEPSSSSGTRLRLPSTARSPTRRRPVKPTSTACCPIPKSCAFESARAAAPASGCRSCLRPTSSGRAATSSGAPSSARSRSSSKRRRSRASRRC